MGRVGNPFEPGISHRRLRVQIQACQAVAVCAMVALIWANEMLDLPHNLFGMPATPINWAECVFETAALGLVGIVVLVTTRVLLGRIHYLEGFLHVCSFCKRIHTPAGWVSLERYVSEHTEAVVSHSYCPECAKEHYGIVLEEPKTL
jgi:hypothetical protein